MIHIKSSTVQPVSRVKLLTEYHIRVMHTTLAGWSVARPKSPIFTWSCESRKMLTGFKSL